MIKPLSDKLIDPVFDLMKQNMLSYYADRGEVWNELNIRNHFLSRDGIVIEKDDCLAGFSFYELKERRVHIHTLQIAPKFQNKTLGGRFLIWYRDMARETGSEAITCGVYEDNAARYMYERVGFKEIGVVNGVVQMALPLTTAGMSF